MLEGRLPAGLLPLHGDLLDDLPPLRAGAALGRGHADQGRIMLQEERGPIKFFSNSNLWC